VSANLFLTVAYTWSHALTTYTNASYTVIDPYHPSHYYGNAEGLNFPQNASITAIWNLPWFREAHGLQAACSWRLAILRHHYFPQRRLRYSRVERCEPGHCGTPGRDGPADQGAPEGHSMVYTAAYQAPQPGNSETARAFLHSLAVETGEVRESFPSEGWPGLRQIKGDYS
jgi:hypothetical protein